MTQAELDAAGRALARWLAPYVAAELGVRTTETAPTYDPPMCAVFVSTLGDVVLENAERFFGLLAEREQVTSLALADALGVSGPRNIPSVLTTPLKRRAKALLLPYPWHEEKLDQRTAWRDRDGTSTTILEAIRAETARRGKKRLA